METATAAILESSCLWDFPKMSVFSELHARQLQVREFFHSYEFSFSMQLVKFKNSKIFRMLDIAACQLAPTTLLFVHI